MGNERRFCHPRKLCHWIHHWFGGRIDSGGCVTDEIEKQVERACAQLSERLRTDSTATTCVLAAEIMRDLLAGKFKEEPLPEIAVPKWAFGKPSVHTNLAGDVRIEWSEPQIAGWYVFGPFKPTEREAIEAWNKVFGNA